MREVVFTPRFDRLFRRLPKAIRDATYEKLAAYLENPAHPLLRVKRIKGTDRMWEMNITMSYRLTFEVEGETVILRRIGTHDSSCSSVASYAQQVYSDSASGQHPDADP